MKKKNLVPVTALCVAGILALGGCAQQGEKDKQEGDQVVLKVGASPSPHGEILQQAAPILEKEGIQLEIQEFTDYILPNQALENGELDANFFQHKPYLDNFNEENGTHLESLGTVHFEAMGIYAGKCGDRKNLPEGAQVGVPSDPTNEARALQLLEQEGLITLKEGAGLTATAQDIEENPLKLQLVELEAAILPRSLADLDIGVINGNYALEGDVVDQLLVSESADSQAAQTFSNIVAIREGDDNPALEKLLQVLQGEEIRAYIEETYETVFPSAA